MSNGSQTGGAAREGDVLAGKYLVERVLGAGGMGVVVAARHLQLNTRVAIKFLLPGLVTSAEAVSRFAREARAAVQITSEHVARVFDVGTLENGAPFMVMEFLQGEDLGAWVEQRGALSIEQTIEFVLQASVGLAEAHSLGIVHRDLKPSNLFCVRRSDGRLSIKVLDFGISKMADAVGAGALSVTKTSAMMGSPLYMSPEQMESAKNVDVRTDIWALGITLFQLLTARLPFEGDTFPEVLMKVATRPPASLRTFRPEAPAALEAVIARCLQKDPRSRYENVARFALALGELGPPRVGPLVERIACIIEAAGGSWGTPSVRPPERLSAAPREETMGPLGSTVTKSSRRPKAILGALGVFGALAALFSLGVAGRKTPAPMLESAERSTTDSASNVRDLVPEKLATPPATAPVPSPPASSPPTTLPPAPVAKVLAEGGAGALRVLPSQNRVPRDPVTTRAPPPAVHPDNCEPPFYIDAEGNHVFKKECVK